MLISVFRRVHTDASNWHTVEAVSSVRCLSFPERIALLMLCEAGERLSFSVRPDRTFRWRTSTKTLVIGLSEIEYETMESSGVPISTEISFGPTGKIELLE